MKKLIRFIVIVSLFLFLLTPNIVKGNDNPFSDIENSYARDAIIDLYYASVINGVGDGKFNPKANITRQDFAIIMAKALNLDTTKRPEKPTFTDVPVGHYSYAYVEAAVEAGLFTGIGNGKFGLNTKLTREQMAVVFVNALSVDTSGMRRSLSFSDNDLISDWAKDSVAYAVEAELFVGTPEGSFNPLAPAERQQVALVTKKFINLIKKYPKPFPNPDPPIYTVPDPEPKTQPNPK